MPKSYKITISTKFDTPEEEDGLLPTVKQRMLAGIIPGPETHVRASNKPAAFDDYQTYDIEHEYTMRIEGRSFDTGTAFTKFIAKGQIKAYYSSSQQLLLLSGKKADILDFCRQAAPLPGMRLETIQIDMKALQEKLPEVRGVWFRLKQGFIRAKGFMGDQIQDTAEFCEAKMEGDISTLSFYFLDSRDGCMHPVMITEDGAIVLQRNYKKIEEELDIIRQVKAELVDGLFSVVEPASAKHHVEYPAVV
jgi:hypothetical protein